MRKKVVKQTKRLCFVFEEHMFGHPYVWMVQRGRQTDRPGTC